MRARAAPRPVLSPHWSGALPGKRPRSWALGGAPGVASSALRRKALSSSCPRPLGISGALLSVCHALPDPLSLWAEVASGSGPRPGKRTSRAAALPDGTVSNVISLPTGSSLSRRSFPSPVQVSGLSRTNIDLQFSFQVFPCVLQKIRLQDSSNRSSPSLGQSR